MLYLKSDEDTQTIAKSIIVITNYILALASSSSDFVYKADTQPSPSPNQQYSSNRINDHTL